MYDSILVPLDGSAQAERALPTAIRLAQATGACLSLLTIDVPLPVLTPGLSTSLPATHVASTRHHYMSRVTERVARTSDVIVTPNVIELRPAWFPSIGHEIARHADETSTDLIVMTTHARAVVPRMFLGNVALEVVRWSGTPVLLIKPAASRTPELSSGVALEHVLVALDGSSVSEEVLTPAVELGIINTAEYTLFRALQPQHIVSAPVEPGLLPIDAVAVQDAEVAAQTYLNRIADGLRKRQLRVTTRTALAPNAADAIVHCADNENVDVIAMTTHARVGMVRALLGSVANQVLRRAAMPVLMYRPRGE